LEKDAELDIDAEKKRLHTIDYFASQGIKIDLSAIPQDKLTTHLRKFTDWLKQVKTANVNPAELSANLEMEKAVAETAKNSNETREVVTESMADVLVKQGQAEKAIQLYIKLSFLNPEKSSYFAAKIEQLKGI
jgi:RAB protein geranylgeranyltransferase component A